MSTLPPQPYADWKAPAEDAATLIWPQPPELLLETRDNRRRLASADSVFIQNLPLAKLRRLARRSIGHDVDQPLIATGHQTELHHPGVWAKNPLMDLVAEKLDGRAYHLAVDTDAPKHLSLRWPNHALPLTDDPSFSSAAWSGLLAPPTPGWLAGLERAAREDSHLSYGPVLFDFFAAMNQIAPRPASLDVMLTDAMHALDRALGLKHETLIASTLWQSEPFLAFAHHLLARAFDFTQHYNGALADYRREHGITSTSRPMPDLFIGGEAIEAPFWLDDLSSGKRIRPSVFAVDQGFRLTLFNGAEFFFDPKLDGEEAAAKLSRFLQQNNYRLPPRALTLTLFMRLVLVDQFVHGIGGGRYDQVTDRLIASYFGIQPPRFSVTTGTMYFPGAAQRERVCMPCIVRDGHRLKHAVLGGRKRELVAAIEGLPRKSTARAAAFASMQRDRRAAVATDPAVLKWEQYYADAQVREKDDQTLFDRELFYAIQPRDRLIEMIDGYRAAFNSL